MTKLPMRISGGYSIILAFLFTFFTTNAQNRDTKGFVITLQNDTLPCAFKQKNWKKQPTEILVNCNGKDTSYSPDKINGFIITSSRLVFITRTVRLTNYADKLQDATTSKIPELSDPKKLFLKTLYKGVFVLYVVSDNLNRKHFFIEGPDNLVELYSHYYVQLPGATRIYDAPITIPDKSYQFVLKTLMTPCRTLFSIIENISLDEDQLIQLFRLYDKCLESKKEN